MPVRFAIDGLADLREALRALPADLTTEAADIVYANADAAAQEIRDAYPSRTGNLRDHVTVTHAGGAFSVSGKVKNTAKHAYLYELGTQARHTDLGANRGSMPPGHVFVPIIMRRRRVMFEGLRRLLTEHGLLVTGEA